MRLFLVRHGEAAASSEDSLRPLTNEGKKKSVQVAKLIASLASKEALLVHGQLLRSLETADIIARENPKMRREECSLVSPYGDPVALCSWIIAREERHLVLVGHEPQLSSIASYFLLGELKPILEIKKSGLIVLKKEHESWSLRALLAPKHF